MSAIVMGFRFLRGKAKCCCGHKITRHGGSPSNFHSRMRCQSCRCLRFKTCSPWHKHLIGKVRHALIKEMADKAVTRIRKLTTKELLQLCKGKLP